MSEEEKSRRQSVVVSESGDYSEPPPAIQASAIEQVESNPDESRKLLKIPRNGGFSESTVSQILFELQAGTLRGPSITFLGTIFAQIEERAKQAEAEISKLRKLYENERVRVAVLETQLDNERKRKVLQNVLLTSGGVLCSVAVKLYFDKQNSAANVVIAIALILYLGGWLWPHGAKKK